MYFCTKLHGFFQSLNIRDGFIPDNVEEELCRTFHRYILHPVGIAHQSIVYAQDRTGYKGRVVLQIQLRHESNQVGIFHDGKALVRITHDTLYVQFGEVVLQVLLKGVENTFAYIGHDDAVLQQVFVCYLVFPGKWVCISHDGTNAEWDTGMGLDTLVALVNSAFSLTLGYRSMKMSAATRI